MRNRNYFKRNDKLAHYGLDSVHVDLNLTRSGKGSHYEEKINFGVSKFMRLFKYDLPWTCTYRPKNSKHTGRAPE